MRISKTIILGFIDKKICLLKTQKFSINTFVFPASISQLPNVARCSSRFALYPYRTGQPVGVGLEVALVADEMSVTSPLSLSTQPVAGMIAIGLGLGLAACLLC